MARPDFKSPRLFLASPLEPGSPVALDRDQTNYLVNVLRLQPGATVLVFNGADGEWRAELQAAGRRTVELRVTVQVRTQPAPSSVTYAFAPLKHARLDYMVQKAVEMGAGVLQPVVTRRTQTTRLNHERMVANTIEAAEQCGVLNVPAVRTELRLDAWLETLPNDALLVFCDEDAEPGGALPTLTRERAGDTATVALLIGPEGGFEDGERQQILSRRRVARLSLGPRILRADTAAVAALALIQTTLGDWT